MKKIWKNIKVQAEFYGISMKDIIIREIKYLPRKIKRNLQAWIRKIMEWFSKLSFRWKFWIIWLLLVAIVTGIIYFFLWEWVSDFYGLSNKPIQGQEPHSQIIRNLGWLVWMAISFIGLSIGLDLAIWGRQIQHKSHLQERYEKAASMLGNEVMPVRVAGCRALMSLGIEDKSMKIQCVRLLFAFINNPYLKETEQNEDINVLFSNVNKPLRLDIQEAVNSFSAIYEHYGKKGIDKEQVHLPTYFWRNKHKDKVSLIKADLSQADLKGAYLVSASFQGANLAFVNLEGADLVYADFQGANLCGADVQGANFTAANLQGAYLNYTNLQGSHLLHVNLQGADLYDAELQGADLTSADVQGANFIDAKLQGVIFTVTNAQKVNLSGADITDAKINLVDNLTKEKILSATWGIDKDGKGNCPLLPNELEADPAVKKWLANPHYNKKEEAEEDAEIALREIAEEAAAEIEKD